MYVKAHSPANPDMSPNYSTLVTPIPTNAGGQLFEKAQYRSIVAITLEF